MIWLPFDEDTSYRVKFRDFSWEIFAANLQACLEYLPADHTLLHYILKLNYAYQDARKNHIPWVTDVLRDTLPDFRCMESIEVLREQDHSLRDILFLTSSHAATAPILRFAKSHEPQAHIAVVCLDAHADLCDARVPLWKGNVFTHLLLDDTIALLILIGVPDFRKKVICSSLASDLLERVVFFDHSNFVASVKNLTPKLIDISHLYYSLDIDGLKTLEKRYTAMEYCPFHVIMNLGQSAANISDAASAHQALENACCPKNPDGSYKNLVEFGVGIEEQQVSNIIKFFFQKMPSIQSGIVVQGKRFFGDITEIWGPDFGGKTAMAIRELAKIFMMGVK